MNEQRINEIKDSLRELMKIITDRGQSLSDEVKQRLTQAMEHAATRIQQLRQEEQQQQPQEEIPPTPEEVQQPIRQAPSLGAPPSSTSQLLWILAGQQEDYFMQYLQNYPDASTQSLLNNPAELERTIQFLHKMMPSGTPPSIGGIQHADLNSSNIYGFRYNPNNQKLLVRFQNGGVYSYDNVPPQIYKMFENGAVPARTTGQNRYGKWWTGKSPSLGSSFYSLIRSGGYPYQRIS